MPVAILAWTRKLWGFALLSDATRLFYCALGMPMASSTYHVEALLPHYASGWAVLLLSPPAV